MEINIYGNAENLARIVRECGHRAAIGGLWDDIGQLQFEFMVANGLVPSSTLIDVGCGCLRGGVHFIRYLDENKYFGIDVSASLLDAGYDVELKMAGLQDKLPRRNLLCTNDFDFDPFERSFDFAIAQSLFTHLPLNHIRLCLFRLSKTMKPGARLFATFFQVAEDHAFGQFFDHRCGVRSFDANDPYHYRFSDMIRSCEGLPWRVTLRGDWGHPRDQQMLEFLRTQDQSNRLDQTGGSMRHLDYEAAGRLSAGAHHYRAFVGPPDRFDFMSATQFSLLFTLGLRDQHRVLDFGCGSLRLGRLLIPFLRPGGYCGIDPNRWLITDGIDHELGHSIVQIKQPQFSYNDDFRCDVFGKKFDFVVAQSIMTHCGSDLTEKLVHEVAKVLARAGKFLFSIIEDAERATSPEANGWVYPDCVAYGAARIAEICNEAGLLCRVLPWYHPGAVWYVAAREADQLPAAPEMALLRGGVLFNPQFERSRPSRSSDSRPANSLAPFADHADAVAAGVAADLGTAVLIEPSIAEAGSYGQFRFSFTAGSTGLRPGCTLRLALRHVCQWTPPQTSQPHAPGFTTVSAAGGGTFSVVGWDANPDARDVFDCMFPWQHVMDIRPIDRAVEPGEQIEIIYGNRDRGSQGARIQLFEEAAFAFRAFVDGMGDGRFLPLYPDLSVPIVGGEPVRFTLVTPSNARVGETTRLLIRAEDRYGNVAGHYRGSQSVVFNDGTTFRQLGVEFGDAEAGIYRLDGPVFNSPGDYTFKTFKLAATAFESNPVRVQTKHDAGVSTFWGELHGHTLDSDGRGSVDQYYSYAAQIAGLDVCAVTDHDFMLSDAAWVRSKQVTNAHYRPGRFVTLQAFEWSGFSDVGGDRNIYFLLDDPPIIRSRSYFDYRNRQTYHGSDVGANHIEDVFNFLTETCPPKTVIVVPHYGGRPANPKWHRPELERLVEIFSEHRRSEPWAADFHAAGYRLGNIAGGDDHIGRPGYGFLAYDDSPADRPSGLGLVAIQAMGLTRESVFASLYSRRVYATTGARILLDFTLDGHPMGSDVVCLGTPTIQFDVLGTAPLAVVQVLRDGRVVHEFYPDDAYCFDEVGYLACHPDVAEAVREGRIESGLAPYRRHGVLEGRSGPLLGPSALSTGTRSAKFSWSDRSFDHSAEVSYTARVVQADSELAVSSPIWCRVQAAENQAD